MQACSLLHSCLGALAARCWAPHEGAQRLAAGSPERLRRGLAGLGKFQNFTAYITTDIQFHKNSQETAVLNEMIEWPTDHKNGTSADLDSTHLETATLHPEQCQ